jgi:hypothetical protein
MMTREELELLEKIVAVCRDALKAYEHALSLPDVVADCQERVRSLNRAWDAVKKSSDYDNFYM